MDRSRRVLDVLGAEGLRIVLRDAFDGRALVRAANACRLSYPGRRAQVVPAATLVDDLAKRALEDAEAARALVKALDRACARDLREAAALDGEAAGRADASPFPSGRRAGRLLYALAVDGREAARAAAERLRGRLASAPGGPGDAVDAEAPRSEPEAGTARIEARLSRLEASEREAERRAEEARSQAATAAGDLLQARKLVHSLEARLARLTEENARLHDRELVLQGRLEELEKIAREAESLGRLSSEIKGALRDGQKTLHEVRELLQSRLATPADAARPYLEALAATVRAVQGEIAELRRELEADRKREREAIAELAREAHALRGEVAGLRSAAAPERPARRRGEPERVGLFVDVQNMYYAARQLNARLDFGALIETVSRERRLIRATAYVVQNRDIDQTGFLAMLQQRNYEVRRKDLRVRADGSSKGDWDMEIALEMLDLADALDVVVLASGDGDFVPLVNRIKAKGPRVEVYSFQGSTAKELMEACDRHVPIDEGLLIRLAPPA